MEKILVIDDNESLRYTLTNVLEESGFAVVAVDSGQKALEEIKLNQYELVICDMKLPGMDGMQILKEIKLIRPELPVIMLTAFGDIKNAVEAMKHGAQDYLTKPFNNEEMILTIGKALELKYLSEEVNLLRKKMDETYRGENIIGSSKAMKEIFEQVRIVAPTNLTVLLEGESGTGKEVIANMIHNASERKNKSFVAVDCGAIPESIIESELFGYEKGAFTDAKNQKPGKFELANGGTLFLDEISNLSEPNQIKLLRVIEERVVTRLGGKKPVNLDIRVVAASNVKLADSVNKNRFRGDLFYRLNEFHVELPSLKDRAEDLQPLIDHFIKEANKELNKNVESVSEEVLSRIKLHTWPGNVRELRNVIRRSVLLATNGTINSVHINEDINYSGTVINDNGASSSFEDSAKLAEREIIIKALKESGGNKSKAAKLLNMNERTFYRKIKYLGIS